MNIKQKKVVLSAGICAALGVMLAGGTGILAYMTDTETATNIFTVGRVMIDLEEPAYPGNDSKEVKELVPNETIDKDPQIENTGDNAAVVFMSYDSPMADVVIAGSDGRTMAADGETVIAPADREASHQEIFGTMYGDEDGVNTNWTLIKSVYVDSEGNKLSGVDIADDSEDNKNAAAAVRRIYAYNALVGKDDVTEPLFDAIYLKNVIEGEIDSTIQEVTVKGYAIQAAYLKDSSGNSIIEYDDGSDTDPADVVVDADTAKSVYEIYIGQNGANPVVKEAENNNAKDLKGNDRAADEMYLKVSLDVDDTKLSVGDNAAAVAAVDTNYASSVYTFASSDEAVVTVDPNTGVIRAVAAGTATITVTATADGSHTATASVPIQVDSSN